MTDPASPPLRPQPRLRRRQSTSTAMIVGVIFLAVLLIALLLVWIGGGIDPTASASPGPSGSAASSASPGPSSSASTSAAPASEEPGSSLVDTVVATAVERLLIRDAPGTGAARLGTLEAGALSYVAAGPTEADGFPWYLVSGLGLPPNSGCAGPLSTDPYDCPVWFGWVAAANEAGEPWLTPHEIECPSLPASAETIILARTDLERLACSGNEPFTFRAWWPTIPDGAGPPEGTCPAQSEASGWLLCQNVNDDYVTISESEGYGGVGARISIDPASGLTMPERGTWVELRVHLDDPAAQGCDDAAAALEEMDRPPEAYVLGCRGEMVLEAVQAVDGP